MQIHERLLHIGFAEGLERPDFSFTRGHLCVVGNDRTVSIDFLSGEFQKKTRSPLIDDVVFRSLEDSHELLLSFFRCAIR